ncbi:hypothetical protein BST79_gp016 [Only Syngen Nebraska virus 5]|uniref:hypothetical protein n=1 Tax=Only Syngen Nebraska virus 5 TaxID=1917232 RepID=UPI000901DD4E|nr:hypothetical protein BST79_gp016 [Only Syngen Nebraska virus 5]APC25529.1 hypothetical protein [Only Syngen Nebraska virus 5]
MQTIKNIFNVLKNFFEEQTRIMSQKNIFIDKDQQSFRINKDTADAHVEDKDGVIQKNKTETIEMID